MKTLFYFIVCAVMLLGCSKNEDADGGTSGTGGGGNLTNSLESILKEYNINKPGLKGEGAAIGNDTNLLYLNGRLYGHLWIGGVDRRTKEQFFEWIDSEPLDSVVRQYVGYGNYVELHIGKFYLDSPVIKANDAYCFLLSGTDYNGTNFNYGHSCGLYFWNHGTVKTYKCIGYAFNSINYGEAYLELEPWFEGVILHKLSNGYNKFYICYNMQGDSLFTTKSNGRSLDAINYKEGIRKLDSDMTNSELFKHNIETGEKAWTKKLSFTNIGDKPRMNNYSITKDGNLWTYDVNYTTYDGTKGSLSFILNIDTGEYELK